LKEKEDDGCSSHSTIKPSIELGKSVISITKRNFDKEILKHGAIHPPWRGPPTPFFENSTRKNKDKTLLSKRVDFDIMSSEGEKAFKSDEKVDK
jgi:hypothetical protein